MAASFDRVNTLPAALLSLAERKAGISMGMVSADPNALGATDLLIALAWVIEKTDNGYTGTFEEYGNSHSLEDITKVLGSDDEEDE